MSTAILALEDPSIPGCGIDVSGSGRIFTKLGCNSGACHGKSSGQNGFRLSLLGFESQEDYEHLVKEGRGHRLFPAAPSESLVMAKATADLPHGGGLLIERGSRDFGLLHRWIAQGMPYGEPDDPTLARIAVFPQERVMDPNQEQQLLVRAHYSDGSVRDVTRSVHYEPSEASMAQISPTGIVRVGEVTGNLAIMIRFQDRVDVFRATVPLGAVVDKLPVPRNFIDELVYQKLQTLGLPPAESCDDQTFMRRTAVHIAGRLPRLDETRAFLADLDPDKREKWVDSLLAGPGYADYFANKWSAILRNKRRRYYARGNYMFHDWIRRSLDVNKPYDQFSREIVTASGEMGRNPPVAWYREASDATQQVEDTAQIFLGIRLQCARCHHHPLEKWSQSDYYGFAAFFSRVSRKRGTQPGEETIFHERGTAVATNPKTKRPLKPTPLGGSPLQLSSDQDPREALANWMTARDNPFFARMVVNRYWKHFFGRGLVEPEDDMRLTNPASHPELVEALATHFIDSGFDLKELIRTICRSRIYQLSSHPNLHNGSDDRNFSRHYPRRLPAEVLLDAIDQIAGTETEFPGQPSGTRALVLDAGDPATLFLASEAGVFKSRDGGATWTTLSDGLTRVDVQALAVHPTTPSILYAGTSAAGVMKSSDGGANWEPKNRGLSSGSVQALAIDPSAPSILYASIHGTFGGWVFKSSDSADSWVAVSRGSSEILVWALAVDPSAPSTVYAGADGGGLFRSLDGGDNWTAVQDALPRFLRVQALALDSSSTVYAGTDGAGIFKSLDEGDSWAAVNDGLSDILVQALEIDPSTPSTLYAGTDGGGIFRSLDGGDRWATANEGLGNSRIQVLLIDSSNPSLLYAGTDGAGVFKSTDRGGRWTEFNRGLPRGPLARDVHALGIDPGISSTLYAGTFGGAVFKIEDEESGWVGLEEGLAGAPVFALQVDPSSSQVLYAGSFGDGLFRSTDGGSWVPVNDGLTGELLQALVIHPRTPYTLYAGSFGDGISKSSDSGSSWTDLNKGLPFFPVVRALAIDASGPDILYAAVGGVFKNVDGGPVWAQVGSEWTQKGVSSQPHAWSLVLDPAKPSTLYAGTTSGVFKMAQNLAR